MIFANERAAAQKILGKDGKIPPEKGLEKEYSLVEKKITEMKKAREDFEAKLLELKKANDAFTDSCQAFKDDIDGDNFGLEPRDPKQKKQIADAMKLFDDAVQPFIANGKPYAQVLEETYKTVASMKKRLDTLRGA